ncbi:hypothetical protein AALP_AA5G210500 [Arabis alpina]|uniref:Uncharacterized protein n=1 Tax=Arabis alpina TaxID=50452 RepID=A0A087GYG6_ARAAL|nr:hypothetical protein AALP_AA5G210500 [Arabis alpina]
MKKSSKRENLLSPSSSWRENNNPHRKTTNSSAVSSGCLPGFFNLFLSTFTRRKSITLESKKREERTVVYASPPGDSSSGDGGGIVAPPPLPNNEGEGDAARVSLVGALEKCDRDLEELRRTIDVIKTTYILHKKLEVSPVTARDSFTFSGTGDVVVGTQTNKNTKTTLHENKDTETLSTMMMNHHHEYNKTYNKVNNINLITTRLDHNCDLHDVISKRETRGRDTAPIMVRKVRRTLVESVNQVCDDVASGQRREVAKIGLALHDHICRDLIAETVRELVFSGYDHDGDRQCFKSSAVCYGGGSGRKHVRRGSTNSLPLDACRRRLVF